MLRFCNFAHPIARQPALHLADLSQLVCSVRNYHSSPVVFAWLGDYYRLGTGLLTHDGGKFTQ